MLNIHPTERCRQARRTHGHLGTILLMASSLTIQASGQFRLPPLKLSEPVVFCTGGSALTQNNAGHMAYGDLDRDGDVDLVVARGYFRMADPNCASVPPPPGHPDEPTGGISILLNTGDWSPPSDGFDINQLVQIRFCPPPDPQWGDTSCGCAGCLVGEEVVIANFNDDQYPDIAVSTNGYPSYNNDPNALVDPGAVVIFLNDPGNPGRSFWIPQVLRVARDYTIHGLVAEDFDRDGYIDLAVASSMSGDPNDAIPAYVKLFFGTGTGVFTSDQSEFFPPTSDVDGAAFDVVSGRFDSDEFQPDLVTGNLDTPNVSAFLHDGLSGFARIQTTAGFDDWLFVALARGDFNGDKIDDLAAVNNSSFVSILTGDGTGLFVHQREPGNPDSLDRYYVADPNWVLGSARSVAVGRLDLDQHLDLAIAVAGSGSIRDKAAILVGKGNGRFKRPPKYWRTVPRGYGRAQLGMTDIAIVDLNGDGLNDVVVGNGGTVSVLLNETLQQR